MPKRFEEMVDSIKNNKEEYYVDVSNRTSDKIKSIFFSGNWQDFFNIWNTSFSSDIKESIEYKVITLKLRVHFAILPIRIIQLHQNTKYDFEKSSKALVILENVADKFSSVNDEKDLEDEQCKLTVEYMKQLENFFSSYNGQMLIEELKDSSFMTFFALPYIVNPHEDESMKKIFDIEWLEELIADLETFILKFFKEEHSSSKKEQEIFDHILNDSEKSPLIQKFPEVNSFTNNKKDHDEQNLFENNNELLSHKQIIHSTIKNREIEKWITHQQYEIEDSNSHTKSTQTHISSVKNGTGFSLLNEPHYSTNLVTPSMFDVPGTQSVLYDDELHSTKLHLLKVCKHYKKLKLRFHKLHEDYQKMNEIAEELTIALENSVRGQPVNLDMILQSCIKIFPDRFNTDIQTDSEETSVDLKDEPSKNIFAVDQKNILNAPVPPNLLDLKKIKVHLRRGHSRSKLLLMQALRQKLTLSPPEHRREIINAYIRNDILGLQGNICDINKNSVLPYILQPINSDTSGNVNQQTACRFLNALASLSGGRTYLTSGPIVLNAIIKYLDSYNSDRGDTITLDMLLATLQKLSLRKQQRIFMIEANLVEWLIYHFGSDNFKTGSYRLEYTCALLMNLSLHSAARFRASVIAPLFVSTMASLLSNDCKSILPYVNATLQNFLLNNEINEEAKKLHLENILEYHCTRSDQELRNHISYTLKLHKRECDENLSDDDDEFPDEDDEIFDVLEKELDEDDPVRVELGELHGESLLAVYYSTYTYPPNEEIIETPNTPKNDFLPCRESKNAGLNSSTTLSCSETVFDDLKAEISVANKKSDTENDDNLTKSKASDKNEIRPKYNEEEEDAFLAKPKLMRTPPHSARTETRRETISHKDWKAKRNEDEVLFD